MGNNLRQRLTDNPDMSFRGTAGIDAKTADAIDKTVASAHDLGRIDAIVAALIRIEAMAPVIDREGDSLGTLELMAYRRAKRQAMVILQTLAKEMAPVAKVNGSPQAEAQPCPPKPTTPSS